MTDYLIRHKAPVFKHDCNMCTFLGHTIGHDFYYCGSTRAGAPETYIARYSSAEDAYISGTALLDIDVRINIAKSLHKS